MEDGPRPMREMKPCKKNPNSADLFEADHQAGYESHQSRHGTSQVDAHNNASPKMKDELNRRQSVSKPKAIVIAKSTVYYDPNCKACQKLKQASEAKRRNVKRKTAVQKRKTEKKSRVTKKKERVKSTLRMARTKTNKGRQYYSFNNKGTTVNLLNADPKVDGNTELIYFSNSNAKPSRSSQATLPNSSQNGSKSDVISQNPDTSVNSLSSYNSNMSLDHEPMVSK